MMKNIVSCFEKLDRGKDMRFTHKSLFKKKLLLFLSISSRKKDKMCQSKNVGYLTVVLFYLIFDKIAKKGGKWEPGSKFRYKHSIIKW